MKPVLKVGLVVAGLIFSSKAFCEASEMMRSANALESGKLAVTFYGAHAKNSDLEFRLKGADLIQVPLKGGGTEQFFANGNTDLHFDGKGDASILRFTWRPESGLCYTFKIGVGDYELHLPSGSVTNVLENASPGRMWGADVGWTLLSDTPVSPAVAVSLGYSRGDYSMSRLRSGSNGPVSVDQRFSLQEWQAAVSVSNRWRFFEPFGGLRIFRQTSILRDMSAAERVSGSRDGVSPYVGARLEFLPREAVVLEISAVDETIVAAGLSIGF